MPGASDKLARILARGALVAALALAVAAPQRARAERAAERQFAHVRPLPGFEIGGAAPVLYVNASPSDRQVLLCWKRVTGDLLGVVHVIAAAPMDSCEVESRIPGHELVRERWWLDRAQGFLVCPRPDHWFARASDKPTWSFRCPALGVDSLAGGYDLAQLAQQLAAPARAPMPGGPRYERPPGPQAPTSPTPGPDDYIQVDELPLAIKKYGMYLPPEVRERHRNEVVVLNLHVDTAGKVVEARVVKSVPEVDEAAIASARLWVFKPAFASVRPVPVAVWVRIAMKVDAP